MRESPPLTVVEVGGDRYADLEMAQEAALSDLAEALATAVQEGLAEGRLVIGDGVVRLAEEPAEE